MNRHTLNLFDINAALARHETYASIAKRVGVSRSTIAGIHRDIKNGKLLFNNPRQKPTGLNKPKEYIYGKEAPNGGVPVFTGHETINADRALIISDVHLPYTDFDKLEALPKIAKRNGIRKLVILGDWLEGTSTHHKKQVRGHTLSDQIVFSHNAFNYLSQQFDEFFYLAGNHDWWLGFDTNGEIEFSQLAYLAIPYKLMERFTISPYDRVTLKSGREKWLGVHQAGYSRDPLKIARELAQKYQSNIIVTHMHMTAWGYDEYARYKTVAIGGIVDNEKQAWASLKTTVSTVPTPSVMTLIDGKENIISDW